MRPAGRRREPRLAWAAGASATVHGAALAALLLWSGRAPVPPAPTGEGVQIVWDEATSEAVGEAEAAPAPPEAPPDPPAPEAMPDPEAPRPPAPPPPPPPGPPPPPPPGPRLVEAPPAPPPALDAPRVEAPLPAPPALLTPPLAAELPPAGEPEALPDPPPEPPPPPAASARAAAARPSRQPAAPSVAGVGRATGAVVRPSLDPGHRNAAPAYPETARLQGEQGAVGLDLSIDAQGRVVEVRVLRSSGSLALDAAARAAVAQWRFRPAMAEGRPVAGSIRTTVQFRLD